MRHVAIPIGVTVLLGVFQTNTPSHVLPNQPDSFKFVAVGETGTGEKPQYELADQMAALHDRFKYQTVLLLGGNVLGSERPQDFIAKFERPYKRLLDRGVEFYAALGEQDSRDQRYYKLFNMKGALHYTFTPRPDIQFFALESTYLTPQQVSWLDEALKASKSAWRIAFFHHPMYSSGERHGSDVALRRNLEPLFQKYGVSVVLSAHDQFYERIKAQKNITYFVAGSGGKLRSGNISAGTGLTAAGYDSDLSFIAAEIVGDEMHFNTIARSGATVDSGVIPRNKQPGSF